MSLPKPYPPRKITYIDWNTVIDAIEDIRDVLGLYPGNEQLPLASFYYRVMTWGLAYREEISGVDYLVLEAHPNHPVGAAAVTGDERNWSVYSISKKFGYGDFEWYAYHYIGGAGQRQTYLGGLEYNHGTPYDGLITVVRNDTGNHELWTTLGDGNPANSTRTAIGGMDWTARTKFKLEWRPTFVKLYVDDVLEATHNVNIPTGVEMCWMTEIYHPPPPNTPNDYTRVYFDWRSWNYTPYVA